MVNEAKFVSGQTDYFVGRRGRLTRYLVCALQGYFPVLVRTGAASLAIIYRTGATHVGITGTLAVATSEDGGKSWSEPVEIQPRWNDNRNPAFGVNRPGELIAAYWRAGLHNYADDPHGGGLRYNGKPNERWQTVAAMAIQCSSDGGRTWSTPQSYRSTLLSLTSPYGRIVHAPDGTLLMPAYGAPRTPTEGVRDMSIIIRSSDDGQTWGDETVVACKYNETALLFLPSGRLLAASRSESGHVATLFSDDGGRTWSTPQPVTRESEHPADLTLLQSGKVLLTFGRRIRPMGCGLLMSEDGGETWNRDGEVLLASDGVGNGDLGYPSTVQLADGTIVTVLYYASGSEMSGQWGGWGDVSCQAIHYREQDIHMR